MSATWTTSASVFNAMEQQGWTLFNQDGRQLKRATDSGKLQPVGQRYTIRLLDTTNLRFGANPILQYSDTTNGAITFNPVSGKPGEYVALVENVGNRKYGNINAFTSKMPGLVIPALDTDPLPVSYVGEEVTIKASGGLPNIGMWASVRNQATKQYLLSYTDGFKDVNEVKEWKVTFPDTSIYEITVGQAGSGNHSFTVTPQIKPAHVDPLAWVLHPATAKIGVATDYTWTGGDYPYDVSVDTGTVNHDKLTINRGDPIKYTLNHPTAENVVITINDATKQTPITQAVIVAAPLTVTPSNTVAVVNTNISVSIAGGVAPYTVNVNGVDHTTNTSPYPVTSATPGDVTVTVTDSTGAAGSTKLKFVSALVWVLKPDDGNTGVPAKFTWAGGVAPYTVEAVNMGQNKPAVTIADGQPLEYLFSATIAGGGVVTVTDNVGQSITHHIDFVAPLPLLGDDTNQTKGEPGKDVVLSWSGGIAPYALQLLDSTGAEVDYNDSTSQTSYTINKPAGKYTLKVKDQNNDSIFLVITLAAKPVLAYYLTQADNDALAAANVDLFINGYDNQGFPAQLKYGDVLEARTKPGFEFVSDQHGVKIGFVMSETDDERFIPNKNKTVATWTLPLPNPADNKYVSFIVETQVHTHVSGTNHVYLVDNDVMRELTTARFKDQTGSSSQTTELADFGQFIINLIEIPFKVPANLAGTKTETIRLGNLDTKVDALPFLTDRITIPMGTIKTPAPNGNMLDFANTVTMLHLPYVAPFAVDTQYVIGESLTVEMSIDAYTGKATILLTSSAMPGDVFYQKEVDLGIKIPYANLQRIASENDRIEVGGENGVSIPFIEVLKNDAVLPYRRFNAVVPDAGLLVHSNGYLEVDEIDLVTDALTDEKREIIRLMKDGVIFK